MFTMKKIHQTYISFDIFDTLIKRSVAQPSDIFRMMEQYSEHHDILIPAHFAQLRMDAERAAADNLKRSFTLSEIYQELRSRLIKISMN